MDACTFDCLLSQVAALSSLQCAHLVSVVKSRTDQARAADVIEAAVAAKLHCPHCQGAQLYRHGVANGLQRFRCRGCGRTFSSLTGTPLARLRLKDKWLDYLDCMLGSHTVRKAAEMLDVNKNTSLRWRHRFLTGIKMDRPKSLNGIVEADETFLLESEKACVIWGGLRASAAARHRNGASRTSRPASWWRATAAETPATL